MMIFSALKTDGQNWPRTLDLVMPHNLSDCVSQRALTLTRCSAATSGRKTAAAAACGTRKRLRESFASSLDRRCWVSSHRSISQPRQKHCAWYPRRRKYDTRASYDDSNRRAVFESGVFLLLWLCCSRSSHLDPCRRRPSSSSTRQACRCSTSHVL